MFLSNIGRYKRQCALTCATDEAKLFHYSLGSGSRPFLLFVELVLHLLRQQAWLSIGINISNRRRHGLRMRRASLLKVGIVVRHLRSARIHRGAGLSLVVGSVHMWQGKRLLQVLITGVGQGGETVVHHVLLPVLVEAAAFGELADVAFMHSVNLEELLVAEPAITVPIAVMHNGVVNG